MQIEITGETERLVQAVLATGKFASVADFIDTMAKREQQSNKAFDISETYDAQSSVAGSSGWDDVEIDVYDSYDAHKSRS